MNVKNTDCTLINQYIINTDLIRSLKEGAHVFYALNDNHVKMVFDSALKHINE